MSLERTRAVIDRYLASQLTELSLVAEDAIFVSVATGEEYHGRDEIQRMTAYYLQSPFDAVSEVVNILYGDDKAAIEGFLTGRHIGAFAGIPATNRLVRVPVTAFFDLSGDYIIRGRIYLQVTILIAQLGLVPPGEWEH